MKVKCKAVSLDRFAEPAEPVSPFGRDSESSSCYFNRLYNEVDDARSSSSQGDLNLDVDALVQELNHERKLRRKFEHQLKDLESRSKQEVVDLEADLLEAQEQLANCEQILRMSQTSRASLEMEKQTLLLSLQETTDERFELEQKLQGVTELQHVPLDDGDDEQGSFGNMGSLVRSHSADMLTLTPMRSNCSIRSRDDSAYKGSELLSKKANTSPARGMFTQFVELQQENERITTELVQLKMMMAEAAEKELVGNHQMSGLREVKYKLAQTIESLLSH